MPHSACVSRNANSAGNRRLRRTWGPCAPAAVETLAVSDVENAACPCLVGTASTPQGILTNTSPANLVLPTLAAGWVFSSVRSLAQLQG